MNRAVDHILSHPNQSVRLATLARLAELSPFHFHRVFQAIVGETPADFAKRVRLQRALGMMTGRGGKGGKPPSLAAIARACGFSSPADFSRSFKQMYGAAPSAFDVEAWRRKRGGELEESVEEAIRAGLLKRAQSRANPDDFRVRIRDLPARTVAYIRVDDPYHGGVIEATQRLEAWAERRGLGDGQWLGYQWDNPEVTPLKECKYHIAVVAEEFTPRGEVGRFRFPPMTVAQVEMRGDIEMEIRALKWIYGVWLPRSGYVPDDHPGFEAFIGRPFAHGVEHFELNIQLPVRRG